MNPALNMESALPQSPAAPVAPVPMGRQLYWLLKRELWENRTVWISTIVIAGVLLVGHLIAHVGRALSIADLAERADLLEAPPTFAALIIMGVFFFIAVFYCLDVLYSERRDRSILFWKSLPVSDRMTVFGVALVPVLAIPVFSAVLTLVTQFLMLVMSSFALSVSDLPVAPLWERARFVETSIVNVFHLIGVHGLWYAPIYAWLLLVSAWAQRLPFLWAFLPPAILVAVEKVFLGSGYLGGLISRRFGGGPYGEVNTLDESVHALEHFSPIEFVFDPGLWLGLAVAAGFLLLAARIRGEREPN